MYRMMPVLIVLTLVVCGCGGVQRELTIKSEPTGAVVLLNDEEIGISPVTVSFNWYGDYRVMISHDGYETLSLHKKLATPWYDWPPFDILRTLWPAKATDRYEWTFELKKYTPPTREALIKAAGELRKDPSRTSPEQP
jgi:hypothetical protein